MTFEYNRQHYQLEIKKKKWKTFFDDFISLTTFRRQPSIFYYGILRKKVIFSHICTMDRWMVLEEEEDRRRR